MAATRAIRRNCPRGETSRRGTGRWYWRGLLVFGASHPRSFASELD